MHELGAQAFALRPVDFSVRHEAHVESVGIRELAIVAVPRRGEEEHVLPRREFLAADFDPRNDGAAQELRRHVVAEHLAERLGVTFGSARSKAVHAPCTETRSANAPITSQAPLGTTCAGVVPCAAWSAGDEDCVHTSSKRESVQASYLSR